MVNHPITYEYGSYNPDCRRSFEQWRCKKPSGGLHPSPLLMLGPLLPSINLPRALSSQVLEIFKDGDSSTLRGPVEQFFLASFLDFSCCNPWPLPLALPSASVRRVWFHLHLNPIHPLGSVRGQLDHPFLILQAKKASSGAPTLQPWMILADLHSSHPFLSSGMSLCLLIPWRRGLDSQPLRQRQKQ